MKLEPCITAIGDQVYLQEPLVLCLCLHFTACLCHVGTFLYKYAFVPFQAHLLSCTVHCLLWLQNSQSANTNADDGEEEEEGEGYQCEIQAVLESMTRRMIKCELEDFELVCIREKYTAYIAIDSRCKGLKRFN